MGTVTVNSVSYEIIGELADAKQYNAVSLNAATFNGASDEDQSKMLIMATRLFFTLCWIGEASSGNTPGISWPRTGGGELFADDTTPNEVFFAIYEMAALIGEDPDTVNARSSGSNVQRAKGGEAEVWFFRSTEEGAPRFARVVQDLIAPYLNSSDFNPLVEGFGSDVDDFISVFDEAPNRTEGVY